MTPPANIAQSLERLGHTQPAVPALQAYGRTALSYAGLADQARYVRGRLTEWGIVSGDIVAGFAPSRPEMAIACATLPTACAFAPLARSLTREAYADLLRRLRPKAVLAPENDEHALVVAARELDLAEIRTRSEPGESVGRFALECHPSASLGANPSTNSECAYVMVSSGTTGRAKLVLHDHSNMLAHARAIGDWLRYTPSDIGCHLVPVHLSHGLRNGLMVPLLLGHSVVCLDESDIDGFFRACADFPLTYLTAGFTVYRELLRRANDHRDRLARNRLRFLRIGAGRLEPEEIDRLEQTFGVPALKGLTLTEGAASQDPLPPRLRKRDALGLPFGNEVAILSADDDFAPAGSRGEIVIRGPSVCRGYLDDPELTAASFAGGWFRTGDEGYIDEEGYVYHTGRIREMINRGGEKFSPLQIDAALESLAGVKEAAAFGVTHPRLGQEVVAAVVRDAGSAIREQDVIEHAQRRVGLPGAPRRVYFVDRLPRNEGGKVRRNELAGLVGIETASVPAAPDSAPNARPLSPLETAVTPLFAATLRRPVAPDDDFFLAGGDSLSGTQLLSQVHAAFGVELPVRVLFSEGATVAGMARVIDRMRTADSRAITRDADVPVARGATARQPTVLSPTQRRAWFLCRLDPSNPAYNEVRVHRLVGAVSIPALRAALETLVRRHAILRSTYGMIDGEPMQIIDDRPDIGLELADLSDSPVQDRKTALADLLTAVAERPFDLEAGPLARFLLVRLADTEHVLVRAWHHIVCDGTSAAVFERELSAAYNALLSERPVSLPALALEYSDYAAWQIERLGTDALQRQLDYWKAKLADLPTLRLPTDRARPPTQSYRGGRVESKLESKVVEGFAALGRASGATSFMTFLSAFYLLLYRYTDDEDIAVGTPIAARTRAGLEGLVGFFANTLVLRVSLASAPTFIELVGRVRETALDAYTHQELPFERLVEALAPRRDPSRNPLFQVCFAMQVGPWTELAFDGVAVSRVLPPTTHAKFDLTLTLRPVEGGMMALWEYSADLFARDTIQRMATHFERLLEAIVAQPEQRIGRIPMQSGAERALVAGWSRVSSHYPDHATVTELFEMQAAATPDAVAIEDARRRLTYGELETRANKLANYLRSAGARPRENVGICLERNPGLVVAMLAVLKTGGAYVPLDPELPRERLDFLVRDARASIVLTRSPNLPKLEGLACRALCLDREREAIAAQPAAAAAHGSDATDIACVMYTSGSTGAPKGVTVPHRAIVRLVRDTNYIRLRADDVLAQLANPAFDAATFEIWGALLNGARIAIIARDTLLSPRALAGALEHHAVTALFLTTAFFNQIARDAPEAFAGRQILFGGEAVDPSAVATALQSGRPARLLHVYGPTETTTFATWFEVSAVEGDALTIPIGGPIANTEVYILDRNRDLVPIGVAGEIHIGGPGLARGYLDRPELTAERFIAHPFDRSPDARLYRSGDRARYRADGAIEFLGRLDRQIKIRGHRIEPGEVEAALLRLPQVREAVVIVREEGADTRRMIAYVVGAPEARPTSVQLMRELQTALPQYMVPSAIVVLDALPLTSHGKVDRRALPEPGDSAAQRTGQHVRPRDPLQHMLAKIWEELLGVRNIGVNDSFFDLGGHSLLAAQMMDAVERACGRSVPLTTLFRGATITALARALSGAEQVTREPVTAINATGERPPLFFLHGDFTGGGFYSRELSRALGQDQPFYAVHPHGLVDIGVPESIEAMAADRLRSIRSIRPQGPYALGGHCNGGFVALEIARRLLGEGESVTVLILLDARAPWRAGRVFPGVSIGHEPARPIRPSPESATPTPSPTDRKATRYRRAMASYVPGRYPGRLVVLRSEENKDLRPSLGWSEIAATVETYTIPGDHHTSITRHVAATGAQIKAALEAAFEQEGVFLNRFVL